MGIGYGMQCLMPVVGLEEMHAWDVSGEQADEHMAMSIGTGHKFDSAKVVV